MTHLHLMTLLETHGPLPMSRVAELLGCGLPTATGIVWRPIASTHSPST